MQVIMNAYKVFQLPTEGNNKTNQQFLYKTIVILLSVTPDIPPVFDNNDIIERSSVRSFPSLKKGAKVQSVKTGYICDFCPSKRDKCFQISHTLSHYL